MPKQRNTASSSPSCPSELLVPESLRNLWPTVCQELKGVLSQPSFETWVAPLHLHTALQVSEDKMRVVLAADSGFKKDWVLKNYQKLLEAAFLKAFEAQGQTFETLKVDVQVLQQSTEQQTLVLETSAGVSENPSETKDTLKPAPLKTSWTPRSARSNLNPKYTFEHFVIGQHNRFCHAVALAVAENPAQTYNPFFIYGGVGLGKTHLMQAVGHYALRHHPELTIRYVTAEQFTNDLISAIGRKEMKPFRDTYRKIDILMIDDVQFLEGKERTQEEMFHTFNTLHEAGKQIILSSDRVPKMLSGLEDRLRSRFEWGIMADIQPPDLETRVAILRQKARRDKVSVSDDVLNYIAELHPHNIRELEGALNKLAAYTMLTHTPATLSMAKSILGTPLNTANLSIEQILETVSRYFHLRPSDLKSPSRAKDISYARQVAVYMIRTLTEASFPKIGEVLGGRKHTTILYAYDKLREEQAHDAILAQQIQELSRRIKSEWV